MKAKSVCSWGHRAAVKSTTLKMINRLIKPTSGKILINGEDTTDLDAVTLRRNIGYVIQQIGLFPNMTIEEKHHHRSASARLGQTEMPRPRPRVDEHDQARTQAVSDSLSP